MLLLLLAAQSALAAPVGGTAPDVYYDPAFPWNEVAAPDYPRRRNLGASRRGPQSTPSRDDFYYINPFLAPEFCARPLTLREKMEQQRGEKYRDILDDQFDWFRDGVYNRAVHGTWLERYVSARALRDHLAPFRHPWEVGVRLRKLLKVRNKAERWQKMYHGDAANGDEADAFRHFIWVVFMSLETGIDRARLVSTRHEMDDVTMDSLMDRYNNMVALAEAGRLIRAGARPTDAEVCELAMQLLRERKLVILASYRRDGGLGAATIDDHPEFLDFAHRLLEKKLR